MQPTVWLIIMLACGAAGLYLALPGGRSNLRGLAFLLLAAAAGAVIGLTAPLVVGGASKGWFYALAIIGVLGALRMITHKKPVYSALYFILVIVAVTGMLVLMQAEFLAAALMVIYAGAILVTYVFVIMLAQQSEPAEYDTHAREPFFGCIAGFILLAVITGRLFLTGEPPDATAPLAAAGEGSTLNIGTRLLTNYVIALQIAGVVLLAAMVGAIAIARRKPDLFDTGETD